MVTQPCLYGWQAADKMAKNWSKNHKSRIASLSRLTHCYNWTCNISARVTSNA